MKGFGLAALMAAMLIFLFTVSPANANDTTPQSYDCGLTYSVRRGDTLGIIAARCQTTLREILAANPQLNNPNRIYVGQVLNLPVEESVVEKPGESSPSIPVTGDEASEVESQSQFHTVKAGDSLLKIANTYNVSIEVLLLANPDVTNPNIIHSGQSIRIPDSSEIAQLQSEKEKREEARQQAIVAAVKHEGARWIDVDLPAQKVRAYEGEQLIKTFIVSTGTWRTPTVSGQFNIWIKLRYDDMSGPGYNLKDVPFVMYFYKGYGLHGTYWHDNFGTPMSHGCVNLRTADAEWLFDFAEVGTLVNVH